MSTIVVDGRKESVHVPAQQQLTVSAVTGAGRVTYLDASGFLAIPAGETVTFGPHATPMRYLLEALDGPLSYNVAAIDFPTEAEARQFGTDLYDLSGADAPAASVQASRTVNPTGDDNGLTFTAVTAGSGGNAISIEYLNPGAASAALAVSVRNKVISVSLATDTEGAITSTAAEVLAAVVASAAAAALVTPTLYEDDTNFVDGSGAVTAMARVALQNGAGVGAGTAGPGSRYTDTDTPTLYINTGTKAVPVWTALAEAA